MLWLVLNLTLAQTVVLPEAKSTALRLPRKVVAQATRHAAQVKQFARHPTDEALCQVLQQSEALEQALLPPLAASMEKTASAPARWDKDAAALNRALPGIFFERGMDVLVHGVDAAALAAKAPVGMPTAEALRLTGKLLPPGLPAYFEPQSDLTGCTNPAQLLAPLQELDKVWSQTAPCMKTALTPRLKKAVQDVTGTTCFCGSQQETQTAVEELSKRLAGWDELDGPAAAERLRATLQQGKGRFSCTTQDY
ncbi:hypothetical protein CYFUS_006488 [Cystobacter fuscus]|uniref:Uncharacterized protein n=1 Tax=Cystobacter fuscus TaxID=43 RepID=A0A250JCY4_9BACT|nr:hypothetical protein [Cystobacter fuscus]ATB41026.1 hypothetical protein CYFUS_006488 [Cystobacter fuscus]